MRAYASASGGVMFIPERIERKTAKEAGRSGPVSYSQLLTNDVAESVDVPGRAVFRLYRENFMQNFA